MIKLLKHRTALDPFYVALSDDFNFQVLYGDILVSTHTSVGSAIRSVALESIYGVSEAISDWERLDIQCDILLN